jgi:3-methylcrotonyl-CoA carboxylase alpha subunit
MCDAAAALARHIRYTGAGTVEFLVDGEGDAASFFFLEMNTRLQVEHPVTEAITGLDLVHAQLAIASGEPLPWGEVSARGHAIECRIYAEDPANDFLPQAGRLAVYREPRGPGLRVDGGVVEGGEVTVYYDPLLAKLVARGETREMARRRAIAALEHYPVLGIRTNIPFLVRVLESDRFREGRIDTGYLDADGAALRQDEGRRGLAPAIAAAVAARSAEGGQREAGGRLASAPSGLRAPAETSADPWTRLRDWRM